MKKILTFLILLIAVPCFAQWGTGWANFSGTTTNPLIAAYYTSLYANTIQPLVQGTGQLGTAENAFNSMTADSFFTNGSAAHNPLKNYMAMYTGPTGNATFFASDSVSGLSRTSGTFFWSRSNAMWNFNGQIRAINGVYAVNSPIWTNNGEISTFGGDIYTTGANIYSLKVGGRVYGDSVSGYNGNTWAVNSWGITITGIDTLAKFYMSSFDSTKFVRVWGNIKSPSSGGNPDTLVYMDSLKTDSIKITIAVGAKWLAPAVINKKWPTNPGGVVNPVYCIFRKGATTAAANMQFFTAYGMAKGRVF